MGAAQGSITWVGYNGKQFGTLISGVWYLTQGLRLYQIRHRTLCSLRAYLVHAVRSPKEFLPLGIPRDWTPLSKEADGESHGDA